MPKRFVVTRAAVIAARGVVQIADDRGVGTADAQMRAIARATKIPGQSDAYEVLLDEDAPELHVLPS